MKKIILSVVVIAGFLGFAFYYNKKGMPQAVDPISSQNTTVTNTAPVTPSSVSYKDGSYTGDVTDAVYGNLQVKLTITNGKISDVAFLQYPNDLQHSKEVSAMSLPVLKQEIIQSQTAQVDNVTGATQTSQAFVQSAQSALDKAKS